MVRIPYRKIRPSNRAVVMRTTPQYTCIICKPFELDVRDIMVPIGRMEREQWTSTKGTENEVYYS